MGATSGPGIFTKTKLNKRTEEIIKQEKRIEHVLLVPGNLASKKTRNKGFMFFPIGGGMPEKKASVILQDNIEEPLLIK